MQSVQSPHASPAWYLFGTEAQEPHLPGRRRWRRACVGLLFAAAITCVAQDSHSAVTPATQPNANPQARSGLPGNAKSQTDAGTSAPAKQPQAPADSQRRNQISVESTQLLAMAVELKAEVDKTNKDTLSLNVIRKADAIEKLAKTVKEKMKQSSGPS